MTASPSDRLHEMFKQAFMVRSLHPHRHRLIAFSD
jgi:hypothetical protein